MSETIDLERWVTQQSLAKELDVTVQCVNNWIRRRKIAWQEYSPMPNVTRVLVDKTTVPVISINHKKHK